MVMSDKAFRICNLSIENYKGIDSFQMEFPVPKYSDEPDIVVLGSKNGLGKSSVMECCALLLTCMKIPKASLEMQGLSTNLINPDLIIQNGKGYAKISGELVVDSVVNNVEILIDKHGLFSISSNATETEDTVKEYAKLEMELTERVKSILGFYTDPVIDDRLLFFHSYRKIHESNPEIHSMLNTSPSRRWQGSFTYKEPLNEFKTIIIRSLLDNAKLLDDTLSNENTDQCLAYLNELLQLFAKGAINKFRLGSNNTVDIRITQDNSSNSISFDGFSSGQKEIISTLFLIWYYTESKQSIVFIDEPELHLNAGWHRKFINELTKRTFNNQYIIATHSETIMDSVSPYQRLLLHEI